MFRIKTPSNYIVPTCTLTQLEQRHARSPKGTKKVLLPRPLQPEWPPWQRDHRLAHPAADLQRAAFASRPLQHLKVAFTGRVGTRPAELAPKPLLCSDEDTTRRCIDFILVLLIVTFLLFPFYLLTSPPVRQSGPIPKTFFCFRTRGFFCCFPTLPNRRKGIGGGPAAQPRHSPPVYRPQTRTTDGARGAMARR